MNESDLDHERKWRRWWLVVVTTKVGGNKE
jgi:hypothetical protein